jgi:antitoxin (DNA-binding transcriptional repressor) of toxin-antitoxin stability system
VPRSQTRKDLTAWDGSGVKYQHETALDYRREKLYRYPMTVIKEIGAAHLADLVKQVQAGNEVLLTQGDKPVARIVSARIEAGSGATLRIRSLKGHQVLTPAISQGELAGEMFGQS